jgi:hypothetical protein
MTTATKGAWMVRRIGLTLILAGVAAPCFAAYSGLTIIPTADLLPAGHVCVDYQVYAPTQLGAGADAAFLNTQTGVGDRAEVGLDFDFTRDAATGALANIKLSLRPVDSGLGLAAGLYNAGENLRPFTYLAATRPIGERLRLHLGAQRTPDGESQGFGGVEYGLTGRVWLWGEYLAGDENASALTLYYQCSEHWGIALGLQYPNDEEADATIVFDIGCARPAEWLLKEPGSAHP